MLAAKVLTAGGSGQRPTEAGTLGGNDASTNLIAMATVTPYFVPDARDVKVKPDPSQPESLPDPSEWKTGGFERGRHFLFRFQ